MRGTQDRDRQGDSCQGIIPADAGSTVFADDPKSGLRDHPRGCGEHAGVRAFPVQDPGSSPRMRGARSKACEPSSFGWDHPRGCGEHIPLVHPEGGRRGSSPRMRGAHYAGHAAGIAGGIIPADAGST